LYTALLLFFLIFLFLKINKFQITTIIPIWLFIILVSGLVINSFFSNLQYIDKPKKAVPYLSLLIAQNLLLPLAILSILNVYISIKPRLKAYTVILGSIIIFIGEIFLEHSGVFKYRQWNEWLSIVLWFSLIFISLAFYRFIDFLEKD